MGAKLRTSRWVFANIDMNAWQARSKLWPWLSPTIHKVRPRMRLNRWHGSNCIKDFRSTPDSTKTRRVWSSVHTPGWPRMTMLRLARGMEVEGVQVDDELLSSFWATWSEVHVGVHGMGGGQVKVVMFPFSPVVDVLLTAVTSCC